MRADGAALPNGMAKLGGDKDGGTLFCAADDPRAMKHSGGSGKGGKRNRRDRGNRKKESRPALEPTDKSTAESLDWSAEAQRCVAALAHDRRAALAASLGVTVESLVSIGIGWASGADLKKWRAGGAGWTGGAYPPAAFTFAERSGDGGVVGLSLRAEDGSKGFPSGKGGARRGLIVPSTLGQRPDPVLIVEGATDVAALEAVGIATVGRFSCSGGVTDLAQALHGRECIVIGENDKKPSGKWPGRDGARSVARGLGGEWGRVVPFALPPDGVKDVRAWLRKLTAEGLDLSNPEQVAAAAEKVVDELVGSAQRDETTGDDQGARGHPYKFTPHGIVMERLTEGGKVDVALTNFTARIVADVSRDDGAETRRVFTIEGRIGEGPTLTFDVPAERFASMYWPIEHLGVRAIVSPGAGTKEHLRAAIQHFSSDAKVRVVYAHFGWVRIGDKDLYLHAGGAIGSAGPVEDIEVDPPCDLRQYVLPVPPEPADLAHAVRESLALVNLGPRRITIPLLAAMYRAAVDQCEFSMHIEGFTGALKSSTGAVFLAHFGAAFDDKHLPASWSSTDNALEGIAFAAKDVPLIIDDFTPAGSSQDQARMHAKAERLIRGAGNKQGRARMRADTSFRPTKFARGLIVSTGEEVPSGQSLRARLYIIGIARGDIDIAKLAAAQAKARAGVYASAMAGYIRWLARDLGAHHKWLRDRVLQLRNLSANSHGHLQTATIVAHLQAGFELLLRFARECGAIDDAGEATLLAAALAAYKEGADAQSTHQRDSDPVIRLFELLRSAIGFGGAHVASAAPSISRPDDEVPPQPEAWGWRLQQVGSRAEWRAVGERVGWTDGTHLYLDREAALRVANRVTDHAIALSSTTLAKRLGERGFLVRRESGDHWTVRVSLHGPRRRVLHLRASMLVEPGQSGHPGHDGSDDGEFGPEPPPPKSATQDEDVPNSVPGPPDGPTGPIVPVTPPREPVRPGPPKPCHGCGHLRWFSTIANGGRDWQCAARHSPVLPEAELIWHPGNREVSP